MTATTLAALMTVMVFPGAVHGAMIGVRTAHVEAVTSRDPHAARVVAAVVAAARDLLGGIATATVEREATEPVPTAAPVIQLRIAAHLPGPAPLREALLDLPPPGR